MSGTAAPVVGLAAIFGRPRILAIDPGPTRSAYLELNGAGGIVEYGVHDNEELVEFLAATSVDRYDVVVIERVQSYGMPVGAEVFETVFWSGRFAQALSPAKVERMSRKTVATAICGSARAKDANVRQALIDRFGGKEAAIGLKKTPGPLYGVTGDVWSALAIALAYADGVR